MIAARSVFLKYTECTETTEFHEKKITDLNSVEFRAFCVFRVPFRKYFMVNLSEATDKKKRRPFEAASVRFNIIRLSNKAFFFRALEGLFETDFVDGTHT